MDWKLVYYWCWIDRHGNWGSLCDTCKMGQLPFGAAQRGCFHTGALQRSSDIISLQLAGSRIKTEIPHKHLMERHILQQPPSPRSYNVYSQVSPAQQRFPAMLLKQVCFFDSWWALVGGLNINSLSFVLWIATLITPNIGFGSHKGVGEDLTTDFRSFSPFHL